MNQKKATVTLEDLLKVKRAERPAREFWAQFERDLRHKELAAIVEPRPWWAPFIRVGARVARYQLPIGAAAILALSFVTVREYRTSEYLPSEFAPAAPAPAITAASDAIKADDVAVSAPNSAPIRLAPAMAAAPAANVGERSHTAPLSAELPRISNEPSPSARAIAANLAAVQASDPRMVDNVFGASVRTVEIRQPVSDPLAQVQIGTGSESRRARLLSSALPAVAGLRTVAVGSSDRLARRLTEEQLYDRVSRLDGDANRLVIKF